MANSSIIGIAKNKIIKELIKDDDIIAAIGCDEETTAEQLINKHIFSYHQNPNTMNTVQTFITIQVHIPKSFGVSNAIFVNPTIEIWIISHEENMVVDNVPKVTENRNDYLSRLIDLKLNGRRDFGVGKLELQSNEEGSYQKDYLYRKMVFEGIDVNDSLCERD